MIIFCTAHSAVHFNIALTNLHLPRHPFLQPQCIILDASGRVVQKGCHSEYCLVQPQSGGLRSCELEDIHSSRNSTGNGYALCIVPMQPV